MMHFEFELQEHGLLLMTIILGCLFWIGTIGFIAFIMVVDRLIDEVLSDDDEEQETPEDRDEQGDPEGRA